MPHTRRRARAALASLRPFPAVRSAVVTRLTSARGPSMYSLLLLNGGIGARAGAGQPKQLVKVNGLPILVYSLVAADAVEEITQIVLNYPEGWREQIEAIVADYAIRTP